MSGVSRLRTLTDRLELLSLIHRGLGGDELAQQRLRRTIVSKRVLNSLTTDDVALLALIERRRIATAVRVAEFERDAGFAPSVLARKPPPGISPSDAAPSSEKDFQAFTEVFDYFLERSKSVSSLGAVMFPHWATLFETSWSEPLLAALDDIGKAFGETDDPFRTVSKFIRTACPGTLGRQTAYSDYAHLPILERLIAARAQDQQHDSSVASSIQLASHPGPLEPAVLESLRSQIIQQLDAKLPTPPRLSPVLALLIEIYSYHLHAGDEQATEDEYRHAGDVYSRLAHVVTKNICPEELAVLWCPREALAAASTGIAFQFMPALYLDPDWSYGTPPEPIFALADAVKKLQYDCDFRGSSLSAFHIQMTSSDDADNLPLSCFDAMGHHFVCGDQISSWQKLEPLVDSVSGKAFDSLADALMSGWAFLQVVGSQRPIPASAHTRLRRLASEPQGQYARAVLNYFDHGRGAASWAVLLPLWASERLDVAASRARLSPEIFVPPTDDELALRLREIVSERLWDCLSAGARQDLIEAERAFVFGKVLGTRRERAFFSHLGCAIEDELRRSTHPLLVALGDFFRLDHEAVGLNETRRSLAKLAAAPDHATLGALSQLIAQRHKKLKGLPSELVDGLERSGLVSRVFAHDDYRRAMEAITVRYRNPASHASEKWLSREDVAVLRHLVFAQDLLRRLIEARVDHPLQLGEWGGVN